MPERAVARINRHVAIIVGPVGSLTATYIGLAEHAAQAAETRGAAVSRAYSPSATPTEVLSAVQSADIVIYFGHGTGFPNPYSSTLDPAKVNGWGLQGPRARGDHADSWADGSLAYYGEAWIAANARPKPGFVMIYSNVCYAPGAGEGSIPPSTRDEAVQRAGGYSRTPLAMGASAVFATDFYAGAATLVDGLLSRPDLPYGTLFAADPRFDPAGLDALPHPYAAGAELWLHRSAYFDGKLDYWYAFAGDPAATFAGGRSGGLFASRVEFPTDREIVVSSGDHRAVRVGADGSVAESRPLTVEAPTRLAVSARAPVATQPGAWFRVSEGAFAGWSIAESAAAYLPGVGASHQLLPRRYVDFTAGTHAGHRFNASGAVIEAKTATVSRAARALADAEAIINGQRYLHLTEGTWKNYWILASDAVRLGAPEPAPSIEPAVPSASPSAAASPPPQPLQAPPDPPIAPPESPPSPASPVTASPVPSASPTPQPTTVPSPSPAASTSTAPTPSPSPSASPSPTATEAPSVTPAPSPSPATASAPP